MIWTILGIEETKDKRAIGRAYKERLSAVNPEEKPEEFKELRAAYEKALELADKEDKPDEEKTEIELWTDRLSALYFDLQKRLDVNAWKELLSADICQALDTRAQVEEALLVFFEDNFRIPHKVMVFLNEQFGFTEHMDELREKFPPEFLEFVIEARLRYDDNFPYEYFTPGIDGKAADIYEMTYRKVYNTPHEEAKPLRETLENSSEKHPYGQALLCKMRLNDDDLSAVDELESLQKAYPLDDHLAVDLMIGYEKQEKFDLIEELANKVVERNPQHLAAKRFQAISVAARGDYKKAVDIVQHIMGDVTGEQKSYVELDGLRRKWNDAMMEQLREKLKENPDDTGSLYDLLWCLIQNDRSDEAQELGEKLPPEEPDPFGYYNVKSVLASDAGKKEEALEYTKKLLAAVDNLVPDGTTKTEERIGRRTEVIGRISNLLFELGRKEEALEMSEQSTDLYKADLGSVFNLLSLNLQAKNYERSAEIADIILSREPGNSGAFYLKALSNFKMGRDNIAFEAVNDALDQDGSSLPFYLLKLRILVRNHANEGAEELIKFLEDNGITEDITVDYCKAVMFLDSESEDKKKTKEEYDAILELASKLDKTLNDDKEDIETPDWAGHFYYVYSLIAADRQDFDNEYPVEPLIEILDKGLAKEPGYYSCLSYKAWLLKKSGKKEEAMAIYRDLEKIPGHNISVEGNMAGILYDDLRNNAAEALHYYKMLIENDENSPDNYFYAGMCCFRMEQPEEARKFFELEQKYGPDDIDGYFRMAYTMLKLNRLEEAVENGKKTVEMAKTREGDTVRFWNPLILAYRRLGMYGEAIAAINECAEHNSEWDPRQKLFNIYMQAGMFDKAHEHVGKWRRKLEKNKDASGWTTAKTRLLMAEDSLGKLAFHVADFSQFIESGDQRNANELVAAGKGKLKRYMQIGETYYNKKAAQNDVSPYEKSAYAWCLFVGGEVDKARNIAAEALQEEDEELKKATGMSLIHKARRIRLLAIMGFEEEMRKAIEEAYHTPLCETCEYCCCRDIDIYICQSEFILGNYDKALELAAEYLKKWPDEADFREIQYIIKAKGKK